MAYVMIEALSSGESMLYQSTLLLIQHPTTPGRRNGPCILVEKQLEKKFSNWLSDIIFKKFYLKRHSALQWAGPEILLSKDVKHFCRILLSLTSNLEQKSSHLLLS